MLQFDQIEIVNMQITQFLEKDTTLKFQVIGGKAVLGDFSTHQAQIDFEFRASPETVPSWAVSASAFLFQRHWQVTNINCHILHQAVG